MPSLTPVDFDPFAQSDPSAPAPAPAPADPGVQDQGVQDAHPLTVHVPVGQAPAQAAAALTQPTMTPVDYDPFSQASSQDMGGRAAFAEGIGSGVPIVGPLLEKGADYVGSHIGSWISGKSVDQVLAEGQAIKNATSVAHPIAAATGGLVGAGMALGPAIEAAPAAFGAGPGGLTAAKVAIGGLTGGAIGGTDAAIRSSGDAGSTALGAVGGAIGGAAGPLIGAAAGRIGEGVADVVARNRALQNIGVSRPAAEILTRAAENDGTLGGAGASAIRAAGPDAMLADAGPGIQNVLDTAVTRGGPGAVAARQAVEQRAAAADRELTGALDTSLGRPQGVQTATNEIRTSTATARGDAYDAAYAAPIDYSTPEGQQLETLVRNRVPAGIIARANNQMRIDGNQSRQIIAHLADDGSVTYERLPDVRQLDYITRSLNDVSQRGDGQGALGGNTSEGRSYGNLSRDIRDTLRQAVPEYGTALDTAAQPIQARNALEFGSGLLSPSVPRDVAAETVRGMTAPELQQARQGMRSSIAETLANVKRTITDPNVDARQAMAAVKEMSSDAAQQKIALLISNNEHQALAQAITRATRSLELRAALAQNSKTFVRGMTNQTVQRAAEPGPVGQMLQGEPIKAGKAAVQFFTRNTPADITRREDSIFGELADAATRHRGQAAIDFITRLQNAANTRAAATSFARQLPYSGTASKGILSLLPLMNERTK